MHKATDAKTKGDEAQIKERIQLAYHSALTGGQGSYTKDSLMQELKNEFETDFDVDDSDKDNWILTAKGQSVTIPAGQKEEVKTAILQGKEFWQGGNLVKVGSAQNNITGIVHSQSKPSDEIISDDKHLWSISNSDYDVYFWVIDNVMYWWSEANHICLNTNCYMMFAYWSKLENISCFDEFDTSLVENMNQLFYQCEFLSDLSSIKNWNVSNVNDMGLMFYQLKSLESIDLSKWDTSNVTSISYMFHSCEKLKTIYASDKFVISPVASSDGYFLRMYCISWWKWNTL